MALKNKSLVMYLKNLFILLILSIISLKSFSQDYYLTKTDSIPCSDLSFSATAQGYLKGLYYINSNGKSIEINGRENVPDVLTLFMGGEYFDKVPQKAHKPES